MLTGFFSRSFIFGKRTPLLSSPPQLICAKLLLPLTSSIVDESPELTPTTTIDAGVTFVPSQDTPFGPGNSAYFNGDGCIAATYTSENVIGEDDFTVECWVRSPGTDGYFTVWCAGPNYRNTLYIYDTYLTYYDNSESELDTQNDLYPYDEWHHIAVTRQGGYLRLFIDGYLSDERAESGSSNITSNTHRVGNSFYSSPEYFVGYMSNFRFIKGLALYTEEFTPSAAPLDACVPAPPPPAPPPQTLSISLPANLQCVPAAGAANVKNDIAWYSFSLDSESAVVFETVITEGYTYDTELGVYDSAGTLLGSDDNSKGNGLSRLTLYNLQPGTYYVVVGRSSVNFGPLFNVTSNTPLNDDCTVQLYVSVTEGICEPYQVETLPWETLFIDHDTAESDEQINAVYDDPNLDGVRFNINLGGYAKSWTDTNPDDDFVGPSGVDTNVYVDFGTSPNLWTGSYLKINGAARFGNEIYMNGGTYELYDPTVIARYHAVGGSSNYTSSRYPYYLPTPGVHSYPGVYGYSFVDGLIQAKNYGKPIIFESWFSSNPYRTNMSSGFSNYTFFGQARNQSGPYVALNNVFGTYGSGLEPTYHYVKKYQCGVLKANADMYNLQDSDFVAGVSYVANEDGTQGLAKIIISGTVVDSLTVTSANGMYFMNSGLDFGFYDALADLKTGKSAINYIEILWGDSVTNNTGQPRELTFQGRNGSGVLDDRALIDTYHTKWAWIVDCETGSTATVDVQDHVVNSNLLQMFTVPFTLPCDPGGMLPNYTPQTPIAIGQNACCPYETFPFTEYCLPYSVLNNSSDTANFYNDPTADGITLHYNLGGYAKSWQDVNGEDDIISVPFGSFTLFYDTNVYVDLGTRYRNYDDSISIPGIYQYTTGADNRSVSAKITNSELKSRYDAVGGSRERGPLDPYYVPLPGHHSHPGVLAIPPYNGNVQAKNYGKPIIFEMWFSLNPNRADKSKGYSNYTFFDIYSQNAAPTIELNSAYLPSSIWPPATEFNYVKKYQFGILKLDADMYNLQDSDFIAGFSYVSNTDGTVGVAKIIISGNIVNNVNVSTANGIGMIYPFVTSYLNHGLSDIGTGKTYIHMWNVTMVEAGSTNTIDVYYAGANSSGYKTEAFVDTCNCKWAWIVDCETGSTSTSNVQDYVITCGAAPGMTTLPNTPAAVPCINYVPPAPFDDSATQATYFIGFSMCRAHSHFG